MKWKYYYFFFLPECVTHKSFLFFFFLYSRVLVALVYCCSLISVLFLIHIFFAKVIVHLLCFSLCFFFFSGYFNCLNLHFIVIMDTR